MNLNIFRSKKHANDTGKVFGDRLSCKKELGQIILSKHIATDDCIDMKRHQYLADAK